MIKTVITKRSGTVGWQAKLHQVYETYEEFEAYDSNYGICSRIGFKSTKAAWEANPMIEGSVYGSDLRKVKPNEKPKEVRVTIQ